MRTRVLTFSLSFGITFISVLLTPLIAQEAPPPPPGAPPMGERPRGHPAPKNLKLLPPENLMQTMGFFKASLGVECSFCHVQGNFASDDNPHKGTAREMIVMAREINTKFPDGKIHVTCYTCHRGATEPLTAPEAASKPSPSPAGQ